MAIYFYTADPAKLLAAIRTSIDEGKIKTWSYDSDGDFTHTAEQWKFKAWLRPQIKDGALRFVIFPPMATSLSKRIYGIYHGRFVESVLIHADVLFTRVETTALATEGDLTTA